MPDPSSRRSRRSLRLHNRRLSRYVLPVFAFAVLAAPARAHTDSPGSLPLVPVKLHLKHRKPAEIVALFGRELPPDPSSESIPRAVYAENEGSLVPAGVEAVVRSRESGIVEVVGREGISAVEECVQVLDVPVEQSGPDRQKVTLTLRYANAEQVRAAVLQLADAGTAAASGKRLVLEGKPEWLHRSLRRVIRAELRMD